MSDKALAVISKAKTALAKATTFDDVVRIRGAAKAVKTQAKGKYSPADIKKKLESALDARDRAIEAGAIELMAEYKAGRMLASLRTDKLSDSPTLTVAEACRQAEVNVNIANQWKRLSREEVTEEDIQQYVSALQNSDDPALGCTLPSLQGLRGFKLGKALAAPKQERHDWAIMWLKEITPAILDRATNDALVSATSEASKRNLKNSREGILKMGLVPGGK
jgi:hypothetical protein